VTLNKRSLLSCQDAYDDAIAEGHGAYLLEQDGKHNNLPHFLHPSFLILPSSFPQNTQTEKEPNLFKMNVGNLPPGKEVNISLTYVAELEFVEGSVNNNNTPPPKRWN